MNEKERWIDNLEDAIHAYKFDFPNKQEIILSKDQLECLADQIITCISSDREFDCVSSSHSCVSVRSDSEIELEELKNEISRKERFINKTDPCPECHGEGYIPNRRRGTCEKCNGTGRLER